MLDIAFPAGLHENAASALNSLDFPKSPSDTRVVVAMSGGVDSSLVAALLRQQGYQVVGVTLQLYDHGATVGRKGACCAGTDIRDAREVAAGLDIPHYVLDYESRFKERVIAPFARDYALGETPTPCVACNQRVKFADLLDFAADLGADAMATGHYVTSRREGAERRLYRALDADRDQSYFLFGATPAQLSRLRFPLGDMTKARVRALAREFDLPVAEKADSQDICFVPSGRYFELVERLRPDAAAAGDIVHVDGRLLGRHRGLARYTIGQRKGLGLAPEPGGDAEPHYVIAIDAAANRLVVGPRKALATRVLRLRDVNWIGEGFADLAGLDSIPEGGVDIWAKTRSTAPVARARMRFVKDKDEVEIELFGAQDGIARGQACVFYDSNDPRARVLGGGFVKATEKDATPGARSRIG